MRAKKKQSLFQVEHTSEAFFVLKNGQRVRRKKTYLAAVASALLLKYREQEGCAR